MFFRPTVVSLVLSLACCLPAARSTPPDEVPPLTPAEVAAAVKMDSLSIPTPGELMAALDKQAKPNWQSQYRSPIPTSYSSRAQIALNVGGLIADGYIAVQAEDSQQVKNIGKDIIALAKTLGVSDSVISRGNSIFDFADKNEWSTLKEELEATQNEVKLALEEQNDSSLVSLVSLGGWIRGTQVISGWIGENYTPSTAKLLRQPAILTVMQAKIATLPEKVRSDPLLVTLAGQLKAMEPLVSFPSDKTMTQDDVKRLNAITKSLIEQISKKNDQK
jgi:hypothetical protein